MERASDESEDDLVELPLFPLNIVLFPGMVLPLHIFEERYRNMIGACIENEKPFGVVLIKNGKEVGEPAVPENVGTTTKILETAPLDSGRLNILTRGVQRFEIVETLQTTPHLVGRVRMFPDDPDQATEAQVEQATGEFEVFLRDFGRLAGDVGNDVRATDDPTTLSYAIAAKISSCVNMPSEALQHWLECKDVGTRLASLILALQKLNEALALELKGRASDVGLN